MQMHRTPPHLQQGCGGRPANSVQMHNTWKSLKWSSQSRPMTDIVQKMMIVSIIFYQNGPSLLLTRGTPIKTGILTLLEF
jgi:hypothetical protein